MLNSIPTPITLPSRPVNASGRAFPYNSAVPAAPGDTRTAPAVSSSTSSKPANDAPPAVATKRISSQRLNPNKCSNPFLSNTKKCKSTFSQSYVSGSIPCRLHNTASKFHLHWERGAESGFSPDLLVVCADGLSETEHPYVVLASMMFKELVHRAEGCLDMFVPIVDPVTTHIRKALLIPETFDAALAAFELFLQHTSSLCAPHLIKIVPCLAKYVNDKKRRDSVVTVLSLMEQQCGADATKLIKSKIPTY